MALQAHVKRDLVASLASSLDAAATHLLWFMGMEEADSGGRKFPDLFRRYELNLTDGSWVEDCAVDATNTTESMEYCVYRKLEGIRALCSATRALPKEHHGALQAALKALGRQQENIPGLSLRRDPMPDPTGEGKRGDAEAFVFTDAAGTGRKVLSPTVHATAMATVARCELALGSQVKWSTIAQWFVAADQTVTQVLPQKTLTHHMLGIVWETLSFAAAQLPTDRHKEIRAAEKVVSTVEKTVRKQFQRKKDRLWAYSAASATAFRLNTSKVTGKIESLQKLARAHADRFRDQVLPSINASEMCTCGPVTGLAPLATLLQDPRLAMLVIELVTKDIRLFQVPQDFAAQEGAQLGSLARAPEPRRLRGAFGRHPRQLHMEGRPMSMRVDDTATCLAAVAAALSMVEGMPGVEDADLPQELSASAAAGTARPESVVPSVGGAAGEL
mmetsp:Transcript_17741/g.47402  ORF Transcript_17741/g.47402 Transcript_17741/m.47402 type:complete len:445 (-) Transcript_17741:36-1370(-)